MNLRLIGKTLGAVWIFEALAMALSALVSLIYSEPGGVYFLYVIAILLALGVPLFLIKADNKIFYARDGFAAVAFVWITVSVFGALPFLLSGEIATFEDALFESISGFTTTGASILLNVETMSRGMLFWRSFTHWIGGMGVLVLALALLPSLGARSVYLMQAESPGPQPGKLVPKLAQSARILYLMYIALTLLQIILLLIAGMPLFDALIHAFGTAGTGGFSSKALSVGAYNNVWIEVIITVFMALFGVNFTVYFLLLRRKFDLAAKNQELWFYLGIIAVSIAAIIPGIMPLYGGSAAQALRHSSFQVSTIITTTGFATTDFNLWPLYCRVILMTLMITGACAGSTGGGLKCVRLLLLLKTFKRELRRILHPRASSHVILDGVIVKDDIIGSVTAFFFTYIMIIVGATLLVSLDGHDFLTTFSAVLATIGNIGPGFSLIGPMGNFSVFSPFSQVILSLCMLAGRLEIFPLLVLVIPTYWRKGNQ